MTKTHMNSLSQKAGHLIFFIINLANVNRLTKFFRHQIRKEVCN